MSDVKKIVDLYLRSFKQMQTNRWGGKKWQLRFQPKWLLRLQRENNLEHCGGMTTLAMMVFDHAEKHNISEITELDFREVLRLIWLHDAEECLVGDARSKDRAYYIKERAARWNIIRMLKAHGRPDLAHSLGEYHKKQTREARFVKVIDELQGFAYMLFVERPGWSTRDFSKPDSIQAYNMSEEFPLLREIADEFLARVQARLCKTAP